MSEYKPLTCLPVLPLRGIVVFPGCVTHFDVGRSKSARAVEEAMRGDQMIFLVAQRDVQCDEPKKADLYQIGTVAYVRQILRLPGDNMRILVEGKYRAQLTDMIHSEPYFFARAMELDVPGYNASVPRTQALVRQAHQLFEQFIDLAVKSGQENLLQGSAGDDAGELADFIAQNATFGYEDKQKILETLPPVHRLELCVRTMAKELDILRLESEINDQVQQNVNQNQRDYYLREQLHVIREELGEDDDNDADSYRARIQALKPPKETEEKLLREVSRFARQQAGSAEAAVLRRGTTAHRDMRSIAAELDRLYGASIAYTVRKKGENQCLGFVGSFLDERYVPGGERLLEPMADLLGELLLDPLTRNGRFLSDYVESEKENLIDAIESILNDKRDYADARLLQEMCRGERYGIDRLGTVTGVERLTNQTLYRYYSELLATARIELFYCGSADCARVEGALDRALAALPRERVAEPAVAERVGAPETVREITETMDVTQAKLAMGYRAASEDTPALLLANLIFGGYSNSKLFLNVREKLSLCYYASSGYHRSKGIITVSSGIEAQNYEVARREIAAQLEAVQNGDFEPWELEGARSCMLSSLRSREDSAGRLEEYYLGQAATGLWEDTDALIAQLEAVTPERVAEAARSIRLDTVYFLTGKEGAAQ